MANFSAYALTLGPGHLPCHLLPFSWALGCTGLRHCVGKEEAIGTSYPASTLSARAAALPCAAPDSTGHEQSFIAENHGMSSKILSSRSCLLFRAEACSYLQIFKRRVAHIPSERVKTDGNLHTGRGALARVAFSHPDAHVQCGALPALNGGWAT